MVQSSQEVWSTAGCQIYLNPVWWVGCEDERNEPDRPKRLRGAGNGNRVIGKPVTAIGKPVSAAPTASWIHYGVWIISAVARGGGGTLS